MGSASRRPDTVEGAGSGPGCSLSVGGVVGGWGVWLHFTVDSSCTPITVLASSDAHGLSDAGSLAHGEAMKLEEGGWSSESTVSSANCFLVSFVHLRKWIP